MTKKALHAVNVGTGRVYCSQSRVNPVPIIDGRCVCCGRKVRTVQ